MNKEELINQLKNNTQVLRDKLIAETFDAVDRKDFVTKDYRREAYEDYPLPIGFGQTISQPTTVAFMLELLGTKRGDKVLDIGSGSGWTTALLAKIVGEKGKVIGVEKIPELAELGRGNLKKYRLENARVEEAREEIIGWPDEGPYDKILVSAAAEKLPTELISQLETGGTLVIPIKNSIWRFRKLAEDNLESREYPGFVFVPLVD